MGRSKAARYARRDSKETPRLVDENNPVFASVENLMAGLSPRERAAKMYEFMQAVYKQPKGNGSEQDQGGADNGATDKLSPD